MNIISLNLNKYINNCNQIAHRMNRAVRTVAFFIAFFLASILVDNVISLLLTYESMSIPMLLHRAYGAALLYTYEFPISVRHRTMLMQAMCLSVFISSYASPVDSLEGNVFLVLIKIIVMHFCVLAIKFCTLIFLEQRLMEIFF